MGHSDKELNFFNVVQLLFDCVLPKLRDLLRKKWEIEKPTENLKNKLYKQLKKITGEDEEWLETSVSNGDPSQWNITRIFKALSMLEKKKETEYNGENKKKKTEKKKGEQVKQGAEGTNETEKTEDKVEEENWEVKKQNEELKETEDSKNIRKFKDVRNKLSHWPSREMTNEEKDDIFKTVKGVFQKFGWRTEKIEEIHSSPAQVKDQSKLMELLEEGRRIELRQNQEKMCKIPPESTNFVGRKELLEQCSKVLNPESDKKFLIITGNDGYGKSSLAVKLGYKMYNEGYSYVVWINMQDITRDTTNPSLKDIASDILQKFDIDTSDIKDIVRYLKVKMRMIVESKKRALLIFDNADNLVESERNSSSSSSAFKKLFELIQNIQSNSIRCIFICKALMNSKHHIVNLPRFSENESGEFVTGKLHDFPGHEKNCLVKKIVNIGRGLPYALELMCSEAIVIKSEKAAIDEYINGVEGINSDDDSSFLNGLFQLSYDRLGEKGQSLFELLAYIPFAISSKYLFNVLYTCDSISNPSKLLNQLNRRCLVSSDSGRYSINPYLREFVKTKFWDTETRQKYEEAYYKAYINQLFQLAKESLEKDKFVDCLKEFHSEQQHFLHVMKEVGKGSTNTQSHIRNVLNELLERTTPEYISVVLFLCHEVYDKYSVALIEFFAGCETFVEVQMKKNIWCCRFDVNMAISEEEINDDYEELEADEYGKLLVEKRKCYQFFFRKQYANPNFDDFMTRANNLNDCKVKEYFKASFLKIEVRLSNKSPLNRNLESKKTKLGRALKICDSEFGVHWLTIDCHIQFGKLYWGVNSRDKAETSFDKAIELAEHVIESRKYLSCLVEKGRFLLESKSPEYVEKGKRLIDQALKGCKDFFDEKMRLSAMVTYVKVDKNKREEMTIIFLKKQILSNRWLKIMRSVIDTELYSPSDCLEKKDFFAHEKRKVEKLQQITNHLEYICDDNRYKEEKQLLKLIPEILMYGYSETEVSKATGENKQQIGIRELFIFNMKIATTCMHVLSEHDTKEIATKALNLMDSNDSITTEKREELKFITSCDRDKYLLMKGKCYIEQMGKRIPAMKNKLQKDRQKLLEKCQQYQDVWLWAIHGLVREDKSLWDEVMPYLLRQSEPHELLLKLVLHKFCSHIQVGDRESDEGAIEEQPMHAVDDMKKAIGYIEGLLKSNVREQENTSRALKKALTKWNASLALRTKRVLNEAERGEYARKALYFLEEGDDIITAMEKEQLEILASN